MLLGLLSICAWGAGESDTARGWYLWRTGQDDAARTEAREIVKKFPDSFAAHELHIAMEVSASEGASVEAHYREVWGLDSQDEMNRVTLAMVLAFRNAEAGSWCSEVTALIAPVLEGEAHFWATRAEQLTELRCQGSSDHADAEFLRLTRAEGPGWGDGVLATLKKGYIKQEFPDKLERLWAEQPHRLDRGYLVWSDKMSGPARARARRITVQALGAAAEGSDPVLVHAALQAYRKGNREKRFDETLARLATLDPAADPLLARAIGDVQDPPIYRTIDDCEAELGMMRVVRCLERLDVPKKGAIAAHRWNKIRQGYKTLSMSSEALEAAEAAFLADPAHRFNARMFARSVIDSSESDPEQLERALMAIDQVVADRVVEDPATVAPDTRREALARDIDLQSRIYLKAGRATEAVANQQFALALDATPKRRILLGLVLGDAGRPFDAVLQLVEGVSTEANDTAAIAEGRRRLNELNNTPWQRSTRWKAAGMAGMMREAASGPDDPQPPHPLIGQRLADLEAFDWPVPESSADPAEATEDGEPAEAPEPPEVRVLITWAPFAEESVQALERLKGLKERYEPKGVGFQVVDVGISPTDLPEDYAMAATFGGGEAMRALNAVSPPTAVVVDRRNRIRAVLTPWQWTRVALEKALDKLVD